MNPLSEESQKEANKLHEKKKDAMQSSIFVSVFFFIIICLMPGEKNYPLAFAISLFAFIIMLGATLGRIYIPKSHILNPPVDHHTEVINDVNESAQKFIWKYFRTQTIIAISGSVIVSIFFLLIIITSWGELPQKEMNDLLLLPISPFFLLFAYLTYITTKMQSVFMRQMAKTIGFSYTKKGDAESAGGIALSWGHDYSMKDILIGEYAGRKIRIYGFSQTVGYGKGSRVHAWTVFEITLRTQLSHVSLRPVGAPSVKGEDMKDVVLEGNFNECFSLQIPPGFDSEVRVIFTPDIMHELIEKFSTYRLEASGDHFYVIIKHTSNRKQFLETKAHAEYLFTQMIPSIEAVGVKPNPNTP